MHRRDFLLSTLVAPLLARAVRAADPPRDLRITRVIGFDVVSQRSKVAGKNSRLDVHGDTATDRMLRIELSNGVEGIGNCGMREDAARRLLGRDPFEFFREEDNAFSGPFGTGTMPLWDLLGKLREQPIYNLLGGRGTEQVPVYDGSIYFADLLPQYADDWEARFRAEVDMGHERGHVAFKVKIGRGAKWMPRDEGNARDIAVLKVIRDHAGPDAIIGIDANNGYDLAGTKQLFEQIGGLNIAFAEEMFEETVEDCLAFKEFLKAHGLKTLVADGETQGDLNVFRPFIEAEAIEVYQADMNRFGYEGILTEAKWCEPHALRVAPHNWGSLVGYYMQLHVGRAIPNFYRAEHDPLSNDILIADGHAIKDGLGMCAPAPGAGLAINEETFARDAKVRFAVAT